jgi:hypothetical protein
MTRQSGKALTVTVNTAVAVAMRAAKILAAITVTTATAGRAIRRFLAAMVPIAGTVATGGTVFYLTLNAVMNLAATLTAQLPSIARLFAAGTARLRWAAGGARSTAWGTGNTVLRWTAAGARSIWAGITGQGRWPPGSSRG